MNPDPEGLGFRRARPRVIQPLHDRLWKRCKARCNRAGARFTDPALCGGFCVSRAWLLRSVDRINAGASRSRKRES
jgi:hypothetical protein